MPAEREDSAREVHLEGLGLIVAGALLLAAIGGAFFAGRWVERREQASRLGAPSDRPGVLSQVVGAPGVADATEDATYFDRVEGGNQEPEPAREARPRPAEPAPHGGPAADEERRPSSTPEAGQRASGAEVPSGGANGAFYVQVFAGHDRSAANQVIDRLKGAGYEVRLFADAEGGGAILRVRVGGYPSEERARSIAGNLRQSGYADAFVTRIE